MFAEGVNIKYDGNEDWCGLKRKLNVVSEVCGYTKGLPRHFETWWWNKDVDVAMPRERESYLVFGNRVGMRKIKRNIARQKMIVCSCHVTYAFQRESTLYSIVA